MVGLVFVSLDLQAAWNSWWECSLLGGNPQGPGVRSKNASSRRFSSAISSVSGKNHFLTVGLGYPIYQMEKMLPSRFSIMLGCYEGFCKLS